MSIPVVAIIGGGFCGMMSAVQLCRQSKMPLKIKIVNDKYPFAKGVAYNAHSSEYLLNVIAENMSAFPEAASHFTNWLIEKKFYQNSDVELLRRSFQSRKLYGKYLVAVWNDTIRTKSSFIDINFIEDFAKDIEADHQSYKIILNDNSFLCADIIVLATGNTQPKQLFVKGESLEKCKNFFTNPWGTDCVSNVEHEDNILIVGNGLTMIDTVIGLKENGFKGVIHTLSPNGFALMAHKHIGFKYDLVKEEIKKATDFKQLKRIIYKHIIKVRSFGMSEELVIDALRSSTKVLWQQLCYDEKLLFLKDLSYQWNIVRHRIPLHIYEDIQQMRLTGKIKSYKALVKDFDTDEGNNIHVTYEDKDSGANSKIIIQRIINCTGPNSNLKQSDNLLLRNLSEKGFISADETKLGIKTNDNNFSIVDESGHNHKNIFTLGSSLKGKFWESVAVPELRVQAHEIAQQILSYLHQVNSNKTERSIESVHTG